MHYADIDARAQCSPSTDLPFLSGRSPPGSRHSRSPPNNTVPLDGLGRAMFSTTHARYHEPHVSRTSYFPDGIWSLLTACWHLYDATRPPAKPYLVRHVLAGSRPVRTASDGTRWWFRKRFFARADNAANQSACNNVDDDKLSNRRLWSGRADNCANPETSLAGKRFYYSSLRSSNLQNARANCFQFVDRRHW